jgi:hypothetical protein
MRRAAKTDGSHKAIVQALRQVGCKVSDTSRYGGGFPDLVVRYRGGCGERACQCCPEWRIFLMEIKEPKGKLTPDQEQFIADWPETVIVRSVQEALAAVGVR